MTPLLKAGVAEVDITPPMGVEMCGYGPYEKRVCTEVLDPLYARALWLESAGVRLLIITVDICMLDGEMRNAAVQALAARCGISADAIMMAASHTHSGPATQRTIAWGEPSAAYNADLIAALVCVGERAQAATEPAMLGATRQRIVEVGVNREQTDVGPLDTAAQLLRVDRLDGSVMAVVYNFGGHGVVRYPFTSRISADWPGLVAAGLKFELGGAVPLFLQGPCGNINGHRMTFDRTDPETAQKVCDMWAGDAASRLLAQILPAIKGIRTHGDIHLGAEMTTIPLPCTQPERAALEREIAENLPLAETMTYEQLRPLHARLRTETAAEADWRLARYAVDACRDQLARLEQLPPHVDAPIQVLTIGEAAIVGWPAEVFVELGLELRQRSPIPLTFVASFANDDVGYIPTFAAYESQGRPHQFGVYPVAMTPRVYRQLPFRSDVGSVLVEGTLRMLNGMARV